MNGHFLDHESVISPQSLQPGFKIDGSQLSYINSKFFTESFLELNNMRNDKVLCDLSLKMGENTVHCHKVVLASQSVFIRKKVVGKKKREIEITLENLDSCSVELIVDYVYTGKIEISFRKIREITEASKTLKINSLLDVCINYLTHNLTLNNCFQFLSISTTNKLTNLTHVCQKYICWNFKILSVTDKFLELQQADLNQMLKYTEITVPNEEMVYEAVMRWIAHQPKKRSASLTSMIPLIHFELMEKSYLENTVLNEIAKTNEGCIEPIQEIITMLNDPFHVKDDIRKYRKAEKKIYIFENGSATVTSMDKETLEVKEEHLLQLPPLFLDSGGHYAVKINGSLYAVSKKATIKYDQLKQKWRRFAEGVDVKDTGICSSKVGIFVIGGTHKTKTAKQLDIKRAEWHDLPPLIEGRRRPATARVGKGSKALILVSGGFSVTKNEPIGTMECYMPEANKWRSIKRQMNVPRFLACAIGTKRRVYIIGGRSTNEKLSSVELFDGNSQEIEFSTEDGLTDGKTEAGVVKVNKTLYVIGGKGSLSIESFDTNDALSTWKVVGELPKAMFNLSCVSFPDVADAT